MRGENLHEQRIESMEVGALHPNRPCRAPRTGRLGSMPLSWNSAYELAATESEPPGIMRGARDTDSVIGDNIDSHICVASKTVSRVGAQIHFVLAIGNAERL